MQATPANQADSGHSAKSAPLRGWRRIWHGITDFLSHDPLTLAASIAFYAALSFAPIIVISIWASSQLSAGAESKLIEQLGILFGSQVGDSAAMIMKNAQQSPFNASVSGLVSLGALAISASTAFAQLQAAINAVWGTKGVPSNAVWGWIRRRLLSFGMLAVIGFLLMITLVASSTMTLILKQQGSLWLVINELLALIVFSIGFGLLFRFVPDARIAYRYTFVGGALTAILFELGKWALGTYLGATTSADAYGAASSLILLLIWVYYTSLIVLVGAGLTRHLAEAFDGPLPETHPG
ncbi:MAG TPA: YihY/virulence factor BrkB family protein [Dokdonella sp.]|uniref:YihY/virulence factor BrkB family protein n=1 Tax=Dokdonella sp. TaxID=2291710 RepID=UPI002D7E702B|nr:YihY/virulence factor BrkB family protein [Dokdonella sp.]HET9033585.1 YihY/virulence factor BrkB family protein [Dokdonella sp.]